MSNFYVIFTIILFSILAEAKQTTYFSGEEIMYSSDGSTVYETKPKILKRTLDPEQGKIFEESMIITQGQVKSAHLELVVEGNFYSVSTDDFSGHGQLIGVPWRWTSWTSELETLDGSKLIVVDFLTDEALFATSEFYTPDGKLFVVMEAKLNLVDKQNYETIKKEMLSIENNQ